MKKKGILYGVGVGPGDPELMTLKAVRIIRESDVLLLPSPVKEECRAFRIACEACREAAQKPVKCFSFPMTTRKEERDRQLDLIYEQISALLEEGLNAAFLTIGDPSIYSTFCYMADRARSYGDEVRMVSGITSFTASAARLCLPLSKAGEEIHIIPSESDYAGALRLSGTRIFMKSKKKGRELKELLSSGFSGNADVFCVENCGMEGERIYRGISELPEDDAYMRVAIIRSEEPACADV